MIEKIAPKKYVADKDERLVGDGEMILAENVTISERGEGTFGVLKTMKGTTEVGPAVDGETIPSDWKVVGQVADPQRGRIYFFVYGDTGITSHRIIMYDQADNEWSTVFTSDRSDDSGSVPFLNFSEDYPVTASVINKAFNQDGVVQTVIYFTDNNNPPRKINVDRALAGDYEVTYTVGGTEYVDSKSYRNQRFSLNVIKAPPMDGLEFQFQTDEDFDSNNFQKESFQFALQYLYKDGEESSLYIHPELAVPPLVYSQGVTSVSSNKLEGNVCVISDFWDVNNSPINFVDLYKIRILASSGNSGSFFIIDEFDPREDLIKVISGTEKTIYSAAAVEYRFYNDGYYSNISDTKAQKSYDNVPQKAEGQSISGSRLMYSNYTEGYANHEIPGSDVTLDVEYGSPYSLGGVFSVQAYQQLAARLPAAEYYASPPAATTLGEVVVDFVGVPGDSAWDWGGSPDSGTTTVSPNTAVRINFDYDPEGTFVASSGNAYIRIIGASVSDGTFDLHIGDPTEINSSVRMPAAAIPADRASFALKYTTGEGEDVGDIRDGVKDFITNNDPLSVKSFSDNTDTGVYTFGRRAVVRNSTSPSLPNGTLIRLANVEYEATFAINDTANNLASTSEAFSIRPYIRQLRFTTLTISSLDLPPGVSGLSFSGVTTNFRTFSDRSQHTIGLTSTLYLPQVTAYGASSGSIPTFKHGSSHDFGIVYFDRFGRSGFVNEIGSVYVKHPSERVAGEEGAASVAFTIGNQNNGPDWADFYKVVYGGSQFSNVFSYTTGGGYYVKDGGSSVVNDKRIFVSLKTLNQFQEQTATAKEYSFTKGDICRVISYIDSGSRTYASSNEYGGGIVEFDVVGVEIISASNNPISVTADEYGEYLVLRAPRVDGGMQVAAAADGVIDDDLMYTGFDWYSMTGAASYPVDANPNAGTETNYWGRECVIEILTPKRSSDTKIYYEITEPIFLTGFDPISTPPSFHGNTRYLSQGDVRFRTVSCRTPRLVGATWNFTAPENWRFVEINLETSRPGEFDEEKAWSKGRSHVAFDRAATVNRYNGITFSEPYADDTAVLSLSSFVPANANFFDLPSEHGACRFIGSVSDQMIAIQENKTSRLGIDKNVIETGTQSGLVSLSTSPINNLVSYAADFGTKNPESVLIRDGVVYFADKERQAIVKVADRGMDVISNKDIKSKVESVFDDWSSNSGKHIVSGYDAEDDIFYVTFAPESSFTGVTLGYDEKGGFWQGTYTFYPDRYATLKDSFFGLKQGNDSIIHEFKDGLTSNSFFDTTADPDASKIRIVSNANPSMVKSFQSVSVEGKRPWSVKLIDSRGNSTDNLEFSEREGAFYANAKPIKTYAVSSEDIKDSRYICIGTCSSAQDNIVTMSNNLRGMHIPKGYNMYFFNGSVMIRVDNLGTSNANKVDSVDRATGKITMLNDIQTPANLDGKQIFIQNGEDAGVSGDTIRDHYAVIDLEYTPSASDISAGYDDNELYAVNSQFVNSPLNHALGRQ